jgi:hypothetical protein
MSEFSDIKKLWKSADSQILTNESIDIETVKQAITKQSIRITSKLISSFRAGILALSLNVILSGFNIYAYAGNNLIFVFSISSLILSILLLLFLLYRYNNLNKLDQAGLSLQDLIVAKIKYFKQSLSYVHHAIAISLVLLIISLNLIIDNNGGHYQVNNVWLYAGIMIIAYLIPILMLRLTHNLYLKQYKSVLLDLNESKLTEMNAELRKYKWLKLFFLIIILLSFVVGIIALFFKIGGQ